jgi:hypothetical protein
MKGIPTIRFATLTKDDSTMPPTIRYVKELRKIPEALLRLEPTGHIQLLRQEAYTTISEIKSFHRRLSQAQGVPMEEIVAHYKSLVVSVDGVAECKTGARSLTVCTVRFGPRAIYLWHIFNPLKSNPDARPSPTTILG